MLTQQTLDKLHTLRLTGMREAFAQQLEQPATHDLSFEERLALLVDRELLYRDNRRPTRLLKEAKLRLSAACIEDIDYRHPRALQRPQMASLAAGDWLRAGHNLCITGPTGTGKTYLASAIAPALLYLLHPCSRAPWAIRPADRDSPYATYACRGCSNSSPSPAATAPTPGS